MITAAHQRLNARADLRSKLGTCLSRAQAWSFPTGHRGSRRLGLLGNRPTGGRHGESAGAHGDRAGGPVWTWARLQRWCHICRNRRTSCTRPHTRVDATHLGPRLNRRGGRLGKSDILHHLIRRIKLRLTSELIGRFPRMLRSLNTHQCRRGGRRAGRLGRLRSDGRRFSRLRKRRGRHQWFGQRLGGNGILSGALGAAGLERADIVVLRLVQLLRQTVVKLVRIRRHWVPPMALRLGPNGGRLLDFVSSRESGRGRGPPAIGLADDAGRRRGRAPWKGIDLGIRGDEAHVGNLSSVIRVNIVGCIGILCLQSG